MKHVSYTNWYIRDKISEWNAYFILLDQKYQKKNKQFQRVEIEERYVDSKVVTYDGIRVFQIRFVKYAAANFDLKRFMTIIDYVELQKEIRKQEYLDKEKLSGQQTLVKEFQKACNHKFEQRIDDFIYCPKCNKRSCRVCGDLESKNTSFYAAHFGVSELEFLSKYNLMKKLESTNSGKRLICQSNINQLANKFNFVVTRDP